MRLLLPALLITLLQWELQALSIAIVAPTNQTILAPGASYTIEVAISNSLPVTVVDYFTNGFFFRRATNAPFSTTVTNAAMGRYRITARVSEQNSSFASSAPVFLQVGDMPVGLERGPYLQSGSSTSIVVRWQTDWPVTAVLRYGTNAAALDRGMTNFNPQAEYEMKITGLLPDTRYFYSAGTVTNVFGGGSDFYWRTSGNGAQPVRIWAIGDFGSADQHSATVRETYLDDTGTNTTDVWLMLGDNSYNEQLPNRYQHDVFNVYPTILRHAVAWPVIGNHDAGDDPGGDASAYLDAFTLPTAGEAGGVASGTELYYSFDYANIHFVALDSFVSSRLPDDPMLTWLRNDLASTDKDWIIAFWHHPPYSFSDHHSDFEYFLIEMRQYALPILEEYGVDLVLSGHNHDYERSFLIDGHYGYSWELSPSMILNHTLGRDEGDDPYLKPAGGIGAHRGTVYAVCGCSGQGGSGDDVPKHPVMAITQGGWGSMVITVNGLQLRARFLRSDGSDGDYFMIDKSRDSVTPPRMEIARNGTNAIVSWPTSKPAMTLQSARAVPTNTWPTVTMPAKTNGRRHAVTVPATDAQQFFRLRPPQ